MNVCSKKGIPGRPSVFLRRLVRDEAGQSTTEYVLLLVVLAVIILFVAGTLKEKMMGLIKNQLQGTIQSALVREVHKCGPPICHFR
jgi:Flp pilus assembly pilin Flp